MKFGGRRSSPRAPLAPDAEVIRALAGLLCETGLTEIEYAVGDHRIRVAREAPTGAAPAVNGHAAPQAVAAEPTAPAPAETNGAAHPGTVTSPIVGIAYLAAQPGVAPFVRVGDVIGEGQTLLIIEAMKVMNQIRAPRAGRVSRIFVEDAEPVEYGAALMLVE
ncbi:MAG TPA: biotin/lipoyl-containing protein [Stellaceae bacterium]|jgi:acetyl-CoA carboxylase biotin carboxyl carrier protein|nr:biotin/lipoyl-containing protein [Stellaceae bacterium]